MPKQRQSYNRIKQSEYRRIQRSDTFINLVLEARENLEDRIIQVFIIT